MDTARFREIIITYVTGGLDEAGIAELRRLLDQPGFQELLDEIMQEDQEMRSLKQYDFPASYDRINAVLLSRLELYRKSAAPIRRVRFLSTAWVRYAAAIILLLAGGGYLFLKVNKSGNLPISAASSKPDNLKPGTNRAVLTLADGRQVNLDSSTVGLVASQGNVRVKKLANGQLAYEPNGSPVEAPKGLVYNTLTVPRGGIYQLELPDGSHVWLNSSSSLRYPTAFTGGDRAVELKGEGYFEVAHDPARPFAVTTGGTKVKVLGTGFDIMGYTDESALKVTLVQGSVAVSSSGGRTLLRPGEQVAIRGAATTVQRADLPEVLAWKDGEFRFKGMDIEAIMRQVARWYDVEILYDGPKPVNRFGGVTPRKSEVRELLAVLEATHKVHFKLEGNKITVIGGPGP